MKGLRERIERAMRLCTKRGARRRIMRAMIGVEPIILVAGDHLDRFGKAPETTDSRPEDRNLSRSPSFQVAQDLQKADEEVRSRPHEPFGAVELESETD
jgi:hypothetical protein